MILRVTELDHLPGKYLSDVRLANMREHPGRREVPIVVRRSKGGRWHLVDGQHRLAVARERGETHISAIKDGAR